MSVAVVALVLQALLGPWQRPWQPAQRGVGLHLHADHSAGAVKPAAQAVLPKPRLAAIHCCDGIVCAVQRHSRRRVCSQAGRPRKAGGRLIESVRRSICSAAC